MIDVLLIISNSNLNFKKLKTCILCRNNKNCIMDYFLEVGFPKFLKDKFASDDDLEIFELYYFDHPIRGFTIFIYGLYRDVIDVYEEGKFRCVLYKSVLNILSGLQRYKIRKQNSKYEFYITGSVTKPSNNS